jgi:hypothetical protein
LQRDPGARQSTHDRTDRDLHYLRGLLVAEPFDSHEQQGRSLIRWKVIDGSPHLGERKTGLDTAHRRVRAKTLLRDVALLLANVSRADLINPNRLHDAKHPAIEPRTLLELMLAR